MNAISRQARNLHARSDALHNAYLTFLADCIAECDRQHTPEEIAAAAEYLARDPREPQPSLNLKVV